MIQVVQNCSFLTSVEIVQPVAKNTFQQMPPRLRRERRARHMKKQVLYFCNSMCRQTSSDRIRRSVKMIICLIAVILTDRQRQQQQFCTMESYQMSPVIITGSVITNSTLFLPLVSNNPLYTYTVKQSFFNYAADTARVLF